MTVAAQGQDFVLEEYSIDGAPRTYLVGYFLPSDPADQLLLHHKTDDGALVYVTLSCAAEENECFGESLTLSRLGRRQRSIFHLRVTPDLGVPQFATLNEWIIDGDGTERRRAERLFVVIYWERGSDLLGLRRSR